MPGSAVPRFGSTPFRPTRPVRLLPVAGTIAGLRIETILADAIDPLLLVLDPEDLADRPGASSPLGSENQRAIAGGIGALEVAQVDAVACDDLGRRSRVECPPDKTTMPRLRDCTGRGYVDLTCLAERSLARRSDDSLADERAVCSPGCRCPGCSSKEWNSMSEPRATPPATSHHPGEASPNDTTRGSGCRVAQDSPCLSPGFAHAPGLVLVDAVRNLGARVRCRTDPGSQSRLQPMTIIAGQRRRKLHELRGRHPGNFTTRELRCSPGCRCGMFVWWNSTAELGSDRAASLRGPRQASASPNATARLRMPPVAAGASRPTCRPSCRGPDVSLRLDSVTAEPALPVMRSEPDRASQKPPATR